MKFLLRWLAFALVSVASADTPVLYIIGDSTVETRKGAGSAEQQGWGGQLDQYFHSGKLKIENRAIGGRSSRSFRREGRWKEIIDVLKPGDFVLLQFGHNDGGSLSKDNGRTSLKGMGNESEEVRNAESDETETVHTYGWYMKQYVREAKEQGASVIVCSLVPRCLWADNGKVGRSDRDYGGWARAAARAEKAWFIDLNEIVAERYDAVGNEEKVRKLYFADHHTHTNLKGAELNAQCVVAGLRGQPDCPLNKFLNNKGLTVRPYRN